MHICSIFSFFFQETFPGLLPYEVLYRLYPYSSFLAREGKQSVEDLLATFHLQISKQHGSASIQTVGPAPQDQTAQVRINHNGQQAQFQVRCFVNWVICLVTFRCDNLQIKFLIYIYFSGDSLAGPVGKGNPFICLLQSR
jgi:hypothetical protein